MINLKKNFPYYWEKWADKLIKELEDLNEEANKEIEGILSSKNHKDLEKHFTHKKITRSCETYAILKEHEHELKYFERQLDTMEKQLISEQFIGEKEEFEKRYKDALEIWGKVYESWVGGLKLWNKAELIRELISWKHDNLLSAEIKKLTKILTILTGVLVFLTGVLFLTSIF